MPKLPRISSKKLLRALQRAGFLVDHQTGSHMVLQRGDASEIVVVPNHTKDLKLGTLKSILRQARISAEELIDLL